MQVATREDLAIVLNTRELTGVGVEIGVHHGAFADRFLSRWKGRVLHLVDPWIMLPDYDDPVNTPSRDVDYELARTRMQKYGKRVKFHRCNSCQAVELFADESLDYVYIDANHAYRYVTEDLQIWWPKLRKFGMFAGHDYHYDGVVKVPGAEFECGVRRAVDQFVITKDVEVYVTQDHRETEKKCVLKAASWFLFKE